VRGVAGTQQKQSTELALKTSTVKGHYYYDYSEQGPDLDLVRIPRAGVPHTSQLYLYAHKRDTFDVCEPQKRGENHQIS